MELKDILKQRRLEVGLTLAEVAKLVGVSEATVSRWESGNIANMKRSRIAALAKALQVSPSVIMGWEEPAPAKPSNPMEGLPPECIPIEELHKKRVPLLGRISAGMPILAVENIEGYEWTDNEMVDYALRVDGDSMINARIHDGDVVMVSKQCQIDNGDIVVALINGDDATVKRFYQYNDIVVLRPENPEYKEMQYHAGEVQLLGKVKELKIRF